MVRGWLKNESTLKMCFPRQKFQSLPLETERNIISCGVNINSYYVLGSEWETNRRLSYACHLWIVYGLTPNVFPLKRIGELSPKQNKVKLPAHPVRTGQERRGFPKRKFRSYCAPSCLRVGRDPTYPALAGRGTFRPILILPRKLNLCTKSRTMFIYSPFCLFLWKILIKKVPVISRNYKITVWRCLGTIIASLFWW
jgi:hypothetical protein